MKLSSLASALLAFAFCLPFATKTYAATTQATQVQPKDNIIDDLLAAKEDEKPVVTCESSAKEKNTQCVPKYRFSDEVDDRSTDKFIKWLQAANDAGADEILLEINTPGGSVPAGFEMTRAIEDSDAPVTCVVDGDADSMGFYILQSCDTRLMTPRSKLMAHEPAIGGMVHGQPNYFIAIAEWMKAERDAIAIHCQHRLKISLAEYHKRTDGGLMWWLLSDEAKKVGAVDRDGEDGEGLPQGNVAPQAEEALAGGRPCSTRG